MFNFWEDELTPEQTDALIGKAADEIRKRKLNMPAALFLEMHKPLGNLAGHAAMAFSPFLVPFLGFNTVNDYSRLMSNRDNIEKLLQRLEADEDSSMTDATKEAPCNT